MATDITIKTTSNAYEILEGFLSETAHRLADLTESNSKNICPVRTGALRDSIGQKMPDENTIIVGTQGSEYAIFVEMGTISQSPQPFMRNGLQAAINDLT